MQVCGVYTAQTLIQTSRKTKKGFLAEEILTIARIEAMGLVTDEMRIDEMKTEELKIEEIIAQQMEPGQLRTQEPVTVKTLVLRKNPASCVPKGLRENATAILVSKAL